MQIIKFIKRILFLLPIPLVIIGFTYYVDPANIFKKERYYKQIAKILLQGKNIANLVNYDERLLQKYYINGLPEKRDVVILGSSRIMLIDSNMYKGQSFFNNSVSGATLEDYLAIYWMYYKRKLIPSTMVIGLDPWLLNKNHGQVRFESVREDYQEMVNYLEGKNEKFKIADIIPSKYYELISPSYFQSSFSLWYKNLRSVKKNTRKYYVTTENLVKETLKYADGSLGDNEKSRNVSPEKVYLSAIEYTNIEPVYSLGNFTQLDPVFTGQFDKLIDLMLKDKVKIVFFLSPYHPVTYNNLVKSDKYKIIVEVQRYFEKFAKNKNIEIRGSYNPNDYSLTNLDFYDGMHLKQNAIKRILLE